MCLWASISKAKLSVTSLPILSSAWATLAQNIKTVSSAPRLLLYGWRQPPGGKKLHLFLKRQIKNKESPLHNHTIESEDYTCL